MVVPLKEGLHNEALKRCLRLKFDSRTADERYMVKGNNYGQWLQGKKGKALS